MKSQFCLLTILVSFFVDWAFAASESDSSRMQREKFEAAFEAHELKKAQDETLRLSVLSPEQMADVFARVKQNYWILPDNTLLALRKPKTIEGGQKILDMDKDVLAAHNLIAINATISGIAGRDKYLINHNDAMLEIPGRIDLTENSYVTGYAINDGTFEYVTVLGAGRRIPKYRMHGQKLTIERFLQEVKGGTSFFCMWEISLTCPACRGAKNIKMMPCSRCDSKGKLDRQCLKRVVK